MKNKITNYGIRLFFVAMLLGVVGCQTEPLLDAEQNTLDLSTSTSEAKKGQNSVAFDLTQECIVYGKTDLYAGQHILVGDVSVTINIDFNYEITYNITNDQYCLTETHLSVVKSPELFPNKNGNPKNGHFEYGDDNLDCVSSITYIVPISKGSYIAAHGVVNCVSDVESDAFELSLPNQVDVCVTAKGVPESYFEIDIASENSLTGSFDAWCVDLDAHLNNGECFTGDVYSSYETLPDGKFEDPGNFGAVNWLMNQGFIGTQATPQLGNYTFGDIQNAIWELVDGRSCPSCVFTGPYNSDRVDMLVAMASDHKDFVPSCGDDIVTVIVPTDNKQSIFITIPMPCKEGNCEETAWADGCDFPGNNWATYFQIDIGG